MKPEDISKLNAPGKYLVAQSEGEFRGAVLLCRLRIGATLPPGAIEVAEGQCVVGLSLKCTHMGCVLVPDTGSEPGTLPTDDGLLSCRCHSSCFDLANQGLPVIGPATDCLPSVRLCPTGDPNKVEISGWIQDRSVPYGVPYDKTSATAKEAPHVCPETLA